MPGMITRCPKCATAFKISENHLKSAQGMVRCGSCLHIFDAKAHLEAAAEKVQKPKHVRVQAAYPAPKEPANKTALEKKPVFSTSEKVDSVASNEDADEDAWALALLEDDPEDEPPEFKTPEIKPVLPKKPKPAPPSAPKQESKPEPEKKPEPELTTEENRNLERQNKALAPDNDIISSELISNIPDDTLPLDWQEDTYDNEAPNRRWLWPAAIGVGAIALIAQLAWLQFPALSLKQPYRGYYASACSLIGCELPDLVDRSLILATNLTVRSHPDLKDALLVDVIIKNTAVFEQVFPSLLLSFTDTSNEVVAARSLSPKEYLGGELVGVDGMPIQQPIHIAIDVKDPGDTAVGYKIEVTD